MSTEPNMWYQAFASALDTLLSHVAAIVPSLVAALIIIVVGYFIAKIVRVSVAAVLARVGIEKLSKATGIEDQLRRFGSDVTISYVIATVVYWTILLIFAVTAAESLGLPQLTATIDSFVLFLPKIIATAFILLFGLAAANLAKEMVYKSARSAGFDFAKPVSKIVYGLLVLLVASLAINQLEIETALLDTMISIVLAAIGVGAAISLGLGSRSTSENIMYSLYIADHVQPGDNVTLKTGIKGEVETIGAVATTVRVSDKSLMVINNREFLDQLEVRS